jgi:hypothetical protein
MDSPQERSLDRKSTGIARGQPSGQVSRQAGLWRGKSQVLLEDSPQDLSLDRKITGIDRGQPSGQVSRQESTGIARG